MPAESTLQCAGSIDTTAAPPQNFMVVLGAVALPAAPKHRALGAAVTNDPSVPRLFAKTGLVIKPGVRLQLTVDAGEALAAGLGWGASARPARQLQVPPCPGNDHTWLAYPGGYWVDRPACLTITVTVAERTDTVTIGVGKACPHQQPPAEGALG